MEGSASQTPKFTKKQVAVLNALCHADKNQRKAILRAADKSLVRCILEIVLNTLHGRVPVSGSVKNRLKRHKRALRKLVTVKKRAGKNAWKKKREAILQCGGGAFLPLLIGPIVSALASTIFSAVLKDKNGESS